MLRQIWSQSSLCSTVSSILTLYGIFEFRFLYTQLVYSCMRADSVFVFKRNLFLFLRARSWSYIATSGSRPTRKRRSQSRRTLRVC